MSSSSCDLPTSILFCRLCQSLYRQPRTLPCLHSFCHDCLRQMAPSYDSQGQAMLPCPICSQKAPLPPEGVSAFTSNEFLARMCQEYVGEVQKTLVTSRPLSPASVTSGPGIASPTSVLAGRAPAGHFQYPVSSRSLASSTSSVSPGGLQAQSHRPLSPAHGTTFEYAFRGRTGSSGASAALHAQIAAQAAASTSHTYVPARNIPTSPRHSSSSSSSSDAVIQTARRLSSEMIPFRGMGVQRRLSSTPRDVVRTWECLQRKLNSLQAAALQATYSLENVNMAESNWYQKKQDLKRDIQRRSAQLQFFIKRQERLLLAALDSRNTDDSFINPADHARGEIRANLKSLMHETDVLKSVLDLATDSELMSLSSLLLGSTISQTPVTMESPELCFVAPEMSLEDLVGRDFGCLTSTMVSQTIFTPEDIDQGVPEYPEEEDDAFVTDTVTVDASSTTDAASTATSDNFDKSFDDVAYIDEDEDDEEEEMIVEETFEIIDGKMQVVSKTCVPSSKTRYGSEKKPPQKADTTTNAATEPKDHSTRGRGTETRRTVNSSSAIQTTVEQLPKATEKRQEPHNVKEKQLIKERKEMINQDTWTEVPEQQSSLDKFQHLRESLRQKRRELLLSSSPVPPLTHPGVAHLLSREKRVQSLDRTASLRDTARRSGSPASPQRRHVPSVTAAVIRTPTRSSDSEDSEHNDITVVRTEPCLTVDTSTTSSSVIDTSTAITSPTSPVSPTEKTSRPIRRAISAASDKASKMEYLRETWRRRKELLIQNEAYFTAPPAALKEGAGDSSVEPEALDSEKREENISATAGDHRSRIKQSIRSRISNLKQVLKKNGKAEEGRLEPRTQEKANGGSAENTTPGLLLTQDKPTTAPSTHIETVAEQKVLKTVETILEKKSPVHGAEVSTQPALPLQPNLPSTSPVLTSPGSKPSMVVKPRPREPPAGTAAPSTFIPSTLEPLHEDEGKTTVLPARKPGLRLSSPARGEASKDTIQQVRANVRRKKERWRSLSLT